MSPSESGRNPRLWMCMPFGQVQRNEFRCIVKQPSGLTKKIDDQRVQFCYTEGQTQVDHTVT
ncbi:hypothetical protein Mal15_10400 [Stieleria maiorica]|uniref:Uncharacterized protein n=1 Tax=Stieleria maiorica TaxID=2795974 RepID=A0A5B9MAC0_9BACT|nr:hypothetical protein Mal15_10400 [Stieleria maiorica]